MLKPAAGNALLWLFGYAPAADAAPNTRALTRQLMIAVASAFFVVIALSTALAALGGRVQAAAAVRADAPAAFTPGEFIRPQLTAGYLGR